MNDHHSIWAILAGCSVGGAAITAATNVVAEKLSNARMPWYVPDAVVNFAIETGVPLLCGYLGWQFGKAVPGGLGEGVRLASIGSSVVGAARAVERMVPALGGRLSQVASQSPNLGAAALRQLQPHYFEL